MSITKEQIKDLAKSLGMSMCGVSNVERLKTSPEGKGPCDILPGCKSVIVVGVKLLDGIIQANFRAFEDGRKDLKGMYGTFGYSTLPNFELMYVVYVIAQYIEANSDEVATPCQTGPMQNGAAISIRHAAVAAGLGELGFHSIILAPEYGTRARYGAILTTLELEPDPMYSGPPLCDRCGTCERVCPTGALSRKVLAKSQIGDREFEYMHVNWPKCLRATTAMTKALGGDEDLLPEVDPTPEQFAEASQKRPIASSGLSHTNVWHCGRCLSYCPSGRWKERFADKNLSKGASAEFYDEKI